MSEPFECRSAAPDESSPGHFPYAGRHHASITYINLAESTLCRQPLPSCDLPSFILRTGGEYAFALRLPARRDLPILQEKREAIPNLSRSSPSPEYPTIEMSP